eukprot:617501-Hanusia_phi.AAC.1
MLGTRLIGSSGKAPGPELRNSEPAVTRTHSLSTEAAECQASRRLRRLVTQLPGQAQGHLSDAATAPARGSGRELL